MKAYIAGPMSNFPEFNYPTFFDAEIVLQRWGIEVVNPARLDEMTRSGMMLEHTGDRETGLGVSPASRAEFLRRDMQYLVFCDGIVMLPGWEASVGANVELLVSQSIGLLVFELRQVTSPTGVSRFSLRKGDHLYANLGLIGTHAMLADL